VPLPRRRSALICSLVTAAGLLATVTPAAAQTPMTQTASGTRAAAVTTTTVPVVTLPPAPTTTTTVAPAPKTPAPTTPAPKTTAPATTVPARTTRPRSATTTTTTAPGSAGVPSVPVGGPPTTLAKPGAEPAPAPDVGPIVSQVDSDLAQLTAISDYKPAQALVARAQDGVTEAGATLLSGRQNLDQARTTQAQAGRAGAVADAKLRQLAVAAYIGVGYTTPGINEPAAGNGNQGAGTVSTPGGLTGIEALDAQEMLVMVGQRARQNDEDAHRSLTTAVRTTRSANAVYARDQAAVAAAEARLLAAQQTLKLIETAAVTPGAAAATPLSALLSADTAEVAGTGATPLAAPITTATTLQPAAVTTASADPAAAVSPDILGAPSLSGAQMAAWFASTGRKADVTVPMTTLAASYAAWGKALGVRDDVAFAQSVVETGFFSFPAGGQLTSKDNNFAGIGACDSCAKGWSFPSADTGVQAQLELLREYATAKPLPARIKNVIGGTGVGGCCTTWVQLAGKWASSTVYGISIMTIYNQMLTWLIPQEEVSAGLIAPTTPAAKGPALAPLPGGAAKPTKAVATTATTRAPGVSAASVGKHP
jgi:hypothetical protein